MNKITYDTKCNKNRDCDSNVCEMIYNNGNPIGRYCLISDKQKRYTKKCNFPRDCMSNRCEKIFDNNGHFVTKKCVKAKKRDENTPYNQIFGAERSNKYGIMNANSFGLDESPNFEPGPVSEVILKIFSVIFGLFEIIFYNFRRYCKGSSTPCNDTCECEPVPVEEQGILYSIWRSIFDALFVPVMNDFDSSLFFGGINNKHYDTCKGKCDANSKPIDLWYLRAFVTILFPPFGVFLSRGLNGFKYIIICCILTCFFYFPGLIYAFAVMSVSVHSIKETKILEKKKKEKEKLNPIKKLE